MGKIQGRATGHQASAHGGDLHEDGHGRDPEGSGVLRAGKTFHSQWEHGPADRLAWLLYHRSRRQGRVRTDSPLRDVPGHVGMWSRIQQRT